MTLYIGFDEVIAIQAALKEYGEGKRLAVQCRVQFKGIPDPFAVKCKDLVIET